MAMTTVVVVVVGGGGGGGVGGDGSGSRLFTRSLVRSETRNRHDFSIVASIGYDALLEKNGSLGSPGNAL